MDTEPTLFPEQTGTQLRDIGIAKARDNADRLHENWNTKAYNFALDYCKFNAQFMTEDIRDKANGFIPEPLSKRAWGAITVKLMRNNIVRKIGYDQVKNKKAHCANAALLHSLIYKG